MTKRNSGFWCGVRRAGRAWLRGAAFIVLGLASAAILVLVLACVVLTIPVAAGWLGLLDGIEWN